MQKTKYDDVEGVVFNIQRFSVHDGPGIRTIPFLKGCPLACKWCSNPESQNVNPELFYIKQECTHCGKCLAACKYGALSFDNPFFIERSKCVACNECVDVCLTNALEMKGKRMTVSDVMLELQKDANIYRRSDGGITLSGGEPLSQPDFALEILKACKAKGWHTAMETTGIASKKTIERIMPYVDLALTDIKAIDSNVHKQATGTSNKIILENLIRISEITATEVRVPIIPGVNDDIESIRGICRFVDSMKNVKIIHLLPYHSFGENKYNLLGKTYPMAGDTKIESEHIDKLKLVVQDGGYDCIIGG